MKNKSRFFLLIKVQALSMAGVNRTLRTGSGAENKKLFRTLLLGIVILAYLGYLSWTYASGMTKGLISLGRPAEGVLSMMLAASSVLVLVTGVYNGAKQLFKYRDYDLVMSMPVSVTTVAASRVFMFYAYQLVYTLVLMIPAGAAYAVYGTPPPLFYPVYIILLLLAPAVPSIISAALGAIVTIISSSFKKVGNYVNTLFTLAIALGLMWLANGMTRDMNAMIGSIQDIDRTINSLYPLAPMFTKAAGLDLLSFVSFLVISAGAFAAFCFLISIKYRAICTRVSTSGAKARKLSGTDIRAGSPLAALYRREARMYLSSSVYVTNTIFGSVIAVILSVFMLASGGIPTVFTGGQEIPGLMDMLENATPLMLSMLMAMTCTSCCSVSIEGSGLWIIKALPVRASQLFSAKVLLNLTITVPTSIVCSTLLTIAYRSGPLGTLINFITPLAFALCSAVFGLFINLKMPKLDWKSEIQVVKRSASAFAGVMLPMLICMALVSMVFVFSNLAVPITLGSCLLALILTAGMTLYLLRNGDRILLRL